MSVFQALVIGIVQGLTEFIPISSTAHIRIIPALLGWPDPGSAFTAVIQLGTILAVLIYFREDLPRAIGGWFRGLKGGPATPESKLGWAVFWGTIPIVVLGLLLKKHIDEEFRSLQYIAFALIGLAILLWVAERVARHVRNLDSVKPADGIVVGVWQALALMPGVSRSGSTITGALFLGFDRPTAARFSFLLSVPAIVVSGLYELFQARADVFAGGVAPVVIATLASFFVGYASIEFLMRFLRSHSTLPFIIYRIALGTLLLVLIAKGVLDPMK
jgi:undecaprenyl-diphosphatase